jgi:hypothetical protein
MQAAEHAESPEKVKSLEKVKNPKEELIRDVVKIIDLLLFIIINGF